MKYNIMHVTYVTRVNFITLRARPTYAYYAVRVVFLDHP